MEVTEILSNVASREKCRLYRLRFSFLPHRVYRQDFCVTPAMIISYMERRFFDLLRDVIKRKSLELSKIS